jgi:hydrogenase maturation protease
MPVLPRGSASLKAILAMAAMGPVGFLVIGYGNTLRRDDAVGPRVAEAVAALNLPGVRAIARHQLVPELAGPISEAGAVIFVDAAVDADGGVELRKLEPADDGQILAHATDPRSLLALARQLFGRSPPAWTLAIPVDDLDFGEALSPRAEAGFQAALAQIRALTQVQNR